MEPKGKKLKKAKAKPVRCEFRIVKLDIDVEKIAEKAFKVKTLIDKFPKEKVIWKALGLHQFGITSFAEDSLKALHIKLVRDVEDIEDDDTTFYPEMTYQIFGEKELVAGYQGLKMQLYYSAGSLTTYFNISYETKYEPQWEGDFHPDDLMTMIGEKLQPGFHTNLDLFIKDLDKEKTFHPCGTLMSKFSIVFPEDNSEQNYEVYMVDIVSSPEFKEYNERLQTFLLWYIEAASFIDIDDDKWRFFLMFEKYIHEGSPRYAIVGYITVYEFFCYPNNVRPRISQMLVLPPFQGSGLGAKLLQAVFMHYRELPQVTDIAVESPSEDFQRLRDYVDCLSCASLPSYAPYRLKRGFSKEMQKEAKFRLKMNRKQALRVCNILRLNASNEHNKREMQHYTECLKEQVDKPHQLMLARAKRKHLFETLDIKTILEAMPSLNETYRQSLLDRAAQVMLEQYRQVLKRFNKH